MPRIQGAADVALRCAGMLAIEPGEVPVAGAYHSCKFGRIEAANRGGVRVAITQPLRVVVLGEADSTLERTCITLTRVRPCFAGGEHCPQPWGSGAPTPVLRKLH
ncbi:hypothetical protein GCM10027521_13560 [Amycolatopsis cihanbeyliensis]